MPLYAYEALDAGVQPARGTLTADTAPAARDALRARGLRPLRVAELRQRQRGRWGLQRRAAAAAVAEFWRNLAVLLEAGVTLADALAVCRRQQSHALRPIIQQVEEALRAGGSFSTALRAHPQHFDRLALAIIEVGETAGTLPAALRELAEYESQRRRTGTQLTTTLFYPAILATVGLGVVVFLTTYVIPQLIDVLESAGRSLPWPTRVLQALSGFLLAAGPWLLVGLVLLGIGLQTAWRTARTRRGLERFVLATPLVGDLYRKSWIARLSMMLATLLRSDVRFVPAVRIVRDALAVGLFRDALTEVADGVEAGRDIAAPLEQSALMPPLVIQLLSVGQHSGSLPEMLTQLRVSYEAEVQVSQARFLAVLEPALIVGLALVIGFVVFATILPILETTRVVQ